MAKQLHFLRQSRSFFKYRSHRSPASALCNFRTKRFRLVIAACRRSSIAQPPVPFRAGSDSPP